MGRIVQNVVMLLDVQLSAGNLLMDLSSAASQILDAQSIILITEQRKLTE